MSPAPTVTYAQSSAQAVVDLSTLITIHDFTRFYPSATPDSFQPAYDVFPDGSLVAPPLLDDLKISNILLVITGSLLSVFLRNLFVSAIYAWRGKVKKKALLYVLFLSQLLGPVATIPIIIAQFDNSASCAIILRISCTTSGVSLSLLLTGVLGIKAYRCLDNNRCVLVGLVILSTAATVVLILDVINLRSFHSLSGHCYRPSAGLSSIFVTILLIESSFIFACFLYCVWKSQGPMAVRGRMSLHLSVDDDTPFLPTELRKEVPPIRNHQSDDSDNRKPTSPQARYPPPLSRESSIASLHRGEPRTYDIGVNAAPELSLPWAPRSHISSRSRTIRMSTNNSRLPPRASTSSKRPISPAHSSLSPFTRYIPRMSLFQKVMRDELCYTAVITAFTVVSVAMALVGVKSKNGIISTIWVTLDWALISLLVLHSSGRVIRRHENESLLLNSSVWYHDLQTDRTTAKFLRDVPQPVYAPRTLLKARARHSVARNDINDAVSPPDLSMCHLFTGSAYSSRGELRSLAASTSGTSNTFPPMETESPRTLVHVTCSMESMEELSLSPSDPQKPPEEWFSHPLHPLETPLDRRSFDKSAHVS